MQQTEIHSDQFARDKQDGQSTIVKKKLRHVYGDYSQSFEYNKKANNDIDNYNNGITLQEWY